MALFASSLFFYFLFPLIAVFFYVSSGTAYLYVKPRVGNLLIAEKSSKLHLRKEKLYSCGTAACRLPSLVYPTLLPWEDKVLTLKEELGYQKNCSSNQMWFDSPNDVEEDFNNRLISFINLLYFSRAHNLTYILTEQQARKIQFFDLDFEFLNKYFCISSHKPDANEATKIRKKVNGIPTSFFERPVHTNTGNYSFRRVLTKQLLLRPSKKVLKVTQEFLERQGWEQYSAIFLSSKLKEFDYIGPEDQHRCSVCPYSRKWPSNYIQKLRKKHHLEKQGLFLFSDTPSNADTKRLEKLGAKQFEVNETDTMTNGSQILSHMLVAITSNLFIGSPSSSLAANVAIAQSLLDSGSTLESYVQEVGTLRRHLNNKVLQVLPKWYR